MPIIVTNTNDHPVLLLSHCGNSVQVGSRAKNVSVANKFNWQVPKGVIVKPGGDEKVDPTGTVRGRPVAPLARPPRTAAEAQAALHRGIAPHQTMAARAAAREAAKKILADNSSSVSISPATLSAAQGLSQNTAPPRPPAPAPAEPAPAADTTKS